MIASQHRADGKQRARKDLVAALGLDPKNKSIVAELATLDRDIGITSNGTPMKIDIAKADDRDEKEEENELRENFRRSGKKPLLSDERSAKPKEEALAPPVEPTKEEYERHVAWEAEMLRRKHESEEASVLVAKKKAEEELEDEALMNGTSKPTTGYKLNAEGNKVPVWSREQVVIPTAAPQRVEGGATEVAKIDFNRGYQERDVTQW